MKLIRFFGLSRSGNHAVIQWIEGHFSENGYRTTFINNAPLSTLADTYFYWKNHREAKEAFIVSFENKDLTRLHKFRNPIRSDDNIDVFLMRDPFNLFASRKRKNETNGNNPRCFQINVPEYLQYYDEWTGKTNYLPNKILISYNLWVRDKPYRTDIMKKFGFELTDVNFNKMSKQGSSFDHRKTLPSEMQLEERWKHYQDDPEFKVYLGNPKLQEAARVLGLLFEDVS